MRKGLAGIVVAALAAGFTTAAAQEAPRSTDGTDPKGWDPAQDAVRAASRNHQVVFEDADVRVLSVTIAPGEVEAPHHHQWPSVLVYVNRAPSENRDAKGNLLPSNARPGAAQEQPVVVRLPPEAAHSITNKGDTPIRLIRIEYKHGFPAPPR
jgi:hypothetical protein